MMWSFLVEAPFFHKAIHFPDKKHYAGVGCKIVIFYVKNHKFRYSRLRCRCFKFISMSISLYPTYLFTHRGCVRLFSDYKLEELWIERSELCERGSKGFWWARLAKSILRIWGQNSNAHSQGHWVGEHGEKGWRFHWSGGNQITKATLRWNPKRILSPEEVMWTHPFQSAFHHVETRWFVIFLKCYGSHYLLPI